jgi:hypothetical protein
MVAPRGAGERQGCFVGRWPGACADLWLYRTASGPIIPHVRRGNGWRRRRDALGRAAVLADERVVLLHAEAVSGDDRRLVGVTDKTLDGISIGCE